MLRNVSYNHKKINEEIEKAVGKPFSFWSRIKMGGNGSPKMLIASSSFDVSQELKKDNYPDKAYIELRPRGVCVYFRSLLETWAIIIPYYRLTLYNNSGRVKLYEGSSWVEFEASTSSKPFFDKLIQERLNYLTQFSSAFDLNSI